VRLVSRNEIRLDVREGYLSSGEGLRLHIRLAALYNRKPDAENHG